MNLHHGLCHIVLELSCVGKGGKDGKDNVNCDMVIDKGSCGYNPDSL